MAVTGKGTRLRSAWLSIRAARSALRWGDRDALDAAAWIDWAFESAVAAAITGTLASTQAANTAAALGAVALDAAAAAVQAPGTAAAAGAVAVTGSAAAVQAPGVASASGAVGAVGSGASAEVLARLDALEAQIANLARTNLYVDAPDSITRRHPSIEERERKKARIQKNNEQVLALIGAFLGAHRHEGPPP